jgi:hypothetical protein
LNASFLTFFPFNCLFVYVIVKHFVFQKPYLFQGGSDTVRLGAQVKLETEGHCFVQRRGAQQQPLPLATTARKGSVGGVTLLFAEKYPVRLRLFSPELKHLKEVSGLVAPVQSSSSAAGRVHG